MGVGFVDLCRDDFAKHYNITLDGRLEPLTESARYTIEKIDLNREQLVWIRAWLQRHGHQMDKEPI